MTVVYDILKESLYLYLDVAVYMLFGFFIAGLLHVFFKAEKIKTYLGTGRINPGAALVFLLAGPATNAATINLVRTIFNTRTLVIYLSMIAVTSLAMGVGVDAVYYLMGIRASAVVGQAAEIVPVWIQIPTAVVLAVLMGYTSWKQSTGCASTVCDSERS